MLTQGPAPDPMYQLDCLISTRDAMSIVWSLFSSVQVYIRYSLPCIWRTSFTFLCILYTFHFFFVLNSMPSL